MNNEFLNIEEILSLLNISYEDKGDSYKAKCPNPSHNDKNPSWSIMKNSPYLHNCFSCGFSGNIYSLVKKLTGKSIYKFLNKDPNFTEFQRHLHEKQKVERKTIERKIFQIKGILHHPSKNNDAMLYLKSRGIEKEFIDFFKVQACINAEINGTKFYKRICIPIYDNGELVNIEGRDYTRKSKIKVIYPKNSKANVLLNFDNIDKDKLVFITEGSMGLSSIWQHISKNVISTFGKKLTKHQKELINTLPKICIVTDNDLPDVDNVKDTIEVYDEFYHTDYEIAEIPFEGKDPNDLKPSILKRVLNSRKDAFDILNERYKFFRKEISWKK